MIRVPPQIAAIITSLWALGIGATTQIALPSWAHYAITAAGIILAGLNIIPTTTVQEELAPPYPLGQPHPQTPAAPSATQQAQQEQGLS